MSTLRVDNIKSRTGSTVTIPESNTLAVTGIASISGNTNVSGSLNVTGNANVTGSLNVTGGGNLNNPSGIITAGTLNVTTFNPTNLTVSNNATVGGALTVTGNFTVNGTTTTIDTVNLVVEDKNIGIGTTTSPSNTTADGGGITIFGGSDGDKTLTWNSNSDAFAFSNSVDIKGAVETVSTASTYAISGSTNVILECDAQNGTVFTHSLANGQVGIVSLRDFPVTKNSLTTYTIIFTQNATGTGNTTGSTGIGTNIRLTPYGVAGFSTSARVSSGSTVTISSTANDVDIVSLAVHYNGGSTGTVGNYIVYATDNGNFRYGGIRP
jgi:hypothetical protein